MSTRSLLPPKQMVVFISVVLCSLPKALGNCEGGTVPLRRCVSFPSCMKHEAKNLDPSGQNRRNSIYSPVHSQPNEPVKQLRNNQAHGNPMDSSDLRQTAQNPVNHGANPTEVYTKIQTQLYPHMHFWAWNWALCVSCPWVWMNSRLPHEQDVSSPHKKYTSSQIYIWGCNTCMN